MLTLDMVADFTELSLRRELYLVGEDTAGRRGPVRSKAVVAGDPFCADVCVDLDAVRLAVVGRGGDGVVRQRKRLIDGVARLSVHYQYAAQ